ncbi:MAG: hypothetical protein GY788_27880 [bacterium]|nr:hypothetical protein [bacterium]
MIRIGRLSLALPHSLKDRAGPISRHTGDALAAHRGETRFRADTLSGLSVRPSKAATDAEIGHAIADAILLRVRGTTGDGDA